MRAILESLIVSKFEIKNSAELGAPSLKRYRKQQKQGSISLTDTMSRECIVNISSPRNHSSNEAIQTRYEFTSAISLSTPCSDTLDTWYADSQDGNRF